MFTPLSLSVNVTVAVILPSVFVLVPLKLIVACCGSISSCTSIFAVLLPFVPSNSLPYTICPCCKFPITLPLVVFVQFPSAISPI